MSKYTGVKCPVCGIKFTQADDVVVCPVCGAPHHRACYASKGECAFAADHLSGKEWQPPADPAQEKASGAAADGGEGSTGTCPRCGSKNVAGVIFCQICGSPMGASPEREHPGAAPSHDTGYSFYSAFMREFSTAPNQYGGLSPDDVIDGASVRELAAYVGENSAYYLPRFKLMSENTRMISLNLPAMFFTCLFYFSRKMYVLGAFLLALSAVGAIPHFIFSLGQFPEFGISQAFAAHYGRIANTVNMVYMFASLGTSLFANRFYFHKALKDVVKIRESVGVQDESGYYRELSRKGGLSKISVAAVVAGIFVLYFIAAIIVTYYLLPM